MSILKPPAMVSIDVDTLHDLYPGRRWDADPVYERGLPRFEQLLAEEKIQATLFVVGNDLVRDSKNRVIIRRLAEAGHEIANHSMTHPQGFHALTAERKRQEILDAGSAIADVCGKPPVGFRAPGWNIDEETLDILEELGYLYDSSVFPTWTSMPLKLAYRLAKRRSETVGDRSTMGRWSFQWAPASPYRPGKPLWKRGESRLLEIPVMTVPGLRVPFTGTFSFMTSERMHRACFHLIRQSGRPLNYGLHGVEFVDSESDGIGPMLGSLDGQYIPKTLLLSWKKKQDLHRKTFAMFRSRYEFVTMERFSRQADAQIPVMQR